MKVKIADVILRVREIEVPSRCPHCQADLTRPESVYLTKLEHVPYEGRVWGRSLKITRMEHGDSYAPIDDAFTYVACMNCIGDDEGILAQSEDKILNPIGLEQVVEDTVWSEAVNRVILGGQNF